LVAVQFVRKSEKLARQIEQLELRLEEVAVECWRERARAAGTDFGPSLLGATTDGSTPNGRHYSALEPTKAFAVCQMLVALLCELSNPQLKRM
jgi:hypothetical protein